MSDVLVSFVVPAYNEEALIEACLIAITGEISLEQVSSRTRVGDAGRQLHRIQDRP